MREAREASAAPACVVPGNHDGVHRGHRALIDAARAFAQPRGLRVVALTFDPHPLRLLAPERAPASLTTMMRRVKLLREAGCDDVHVARFDAAFAAQSPERFVDDVLVRDLAARGVVLGPDFRFGARRAGDRALLEELGRTRELTVVPVAPLCDEGGAISSSRIRTRLHEGDVTSAAALLGRPHDVEGVVIRGDQRGRTIGFPTANLQPQDVLLPADGVYAVVARRLDVPDAPCLGGVANLGVRPTVGAGRSVEVHLFDWHGDLYDAPLRVAFVARLREERRFAGLDALVTQIRRDADDARAQVHGREQEYGRWL